MAKPRIFPFILLRLSLLLISTHFVFSDGFPIPAPNSTEPTEIEAMPSGRRKVGDCLSEMEETEMDSDTNRRVLAVRRKYISYETLRRDMILCDKPGASYYNCRPHQANPYHRGCEVITYCARDLK